MKDSVYHFGLFVGGMDLHPIPRGVLKEGAPKLKAKYNESGVACAVFVLGNGERDADTAMDFGAPVNMVVTTDRFPGVSFLLDYAYEVYDASRIFILPYVWPDLVQVVADADLLKFDTKPGWLEYATEANEIESATEGERATATD